MPACGRQHRVNVRKNSLIDADRETVAVESHTRPRIAEQERTHDRNAVVRDGPKCSIEPVER